MGRTIVVTAALTALVGFWVSWLVFSDSRLTAPRATLSPPPPPEPQTATAKVWSGTRAPDATGNVAVVQRFKLQPADAAADRETPAVAIAPDGTIVLAWASQSSTSAPARTLWLARSRDAGVTFSARPWRTVPIYRYTSSKPGKEPRMAFSTHVLPRLATTRDALALGWVEAIDGGPTVRYFVALSSDGGQTFRPPVSAGGASASRPGFTTLATDSGGGLACGWLDEQKPFVSAWPVDSGSEGFGPAKLVFAGPEGKGVCPCCDVSVAVTPNRVAFVAFRNSEGGHRDIWLARGAADAGAAEDGGISFAAPVPVGQERWTFDGCPHDGPSLALLDGSLHVAWMDAHSGNSRVYHAMTPVTEARFEPRPLNRASQGAQGHPRLAAGRDGQLHVVWDESLAAEVPSASAGHHAHTTPTAGGAGRAVMYAVSRDGGQSFSPPHPLAAAPGVYQMQPAMAIGPDGTVYVAWNEIDQDGKHVVLARLTRVDAKAEPPTP
jgi:hypothetical protein